MQVEVEKKVRSELHAWRQFLSASSLWIAVLLFGSGVICWVAANWPALSNVQRFAGAQALVAVSALGAAWTALRLRNAVGPTGSVPGALLALAGLFLGALLALIGQTYQTGADTWQLFAWWAVLLLPWALASASQIVWLLWMAVVNVALGLWLSEFVSSWPWSSPFFDSIFLLMAGVNLVFLCGWEVAANYTRVDLRVGPRVLAAAVLSAVVGIFSFSDVFDHSGGYPGLAWLLVTAGMLWFYQSRRCDLPIIAMVLLGIIWVMLRVVGELLFETVAETLALLLLALMLIASAVAAARWLRGLQTVAVSALETVDVVEQHVESLPAHDGDAPQPWYIQGLLAFGAWLATLFLLAAVFFAQFIESSSAALGLGLVLSAVGVFTLRCSLGLFARQCAAASAATGLVLCAVGLYDLSSARGAAAVILALAALVYILGRDVVLRFLSGGVIVLALAVLIQLFSMGAYGLDSAIFDAFLGHDYYAGALALGETPRVVFIAWFTAALFYLCYRFKHRPFGRALTPLAWAAVLSLPGQTWHMQGLSLRQLPDAWAMSPLLTLVLLAGALLPTAAVGVMLWPRREQLTPLMVWGAPIALAILAFFWLPSQGIAFALTWILMGHGLKQRLLTLFGVANLLLYLLAYYYQLNVPLLQKSLWLCAAAALLFVMFLTVQLIPRLTRTIVKTPAVALPAVSSRVRCRIFVIVAGLALVLGAANYSIGKYERLLAQGRSVILELAPVDPRSLMQGD